jgi:hypothetical protein
VSTKPLNIVIALSLVMLGIGCGNACDDAVDKLEECDIAESSGVDTDECGDKDECAADCIADADCSELKALFGGGMSSATDLTNSKLLSCMSKCN